MKTDITWTSSKILAYLVLIIGSIYGFIFKAPDVLMASFTSAGVVISIILNLCIKRNKKYGL
jgi:hypothetical protein